MIPKVRICWYTGFFTDLLFLFFGSYVSALYGPVCWQRGQVWVRVCITLNFAVCSVLNLSVQVPTPVFTSLQILLSVFVNDSL